MTYQQDPGQPDPNEPYSYDPYGGNQPQGAVPIDPHQPQSPPPPMAAPGYGMQPGYGVPGYGMPGYGMPFQPQNGMGNAGLVCGIIGLALSWIWCLGGPLAILGIIFGGVGMSKANQGQATNKSSAIAGLVCGIVAIALLIVFLALFAEVNPNYDD